LWTVPKSKGMDVMKAVMDFHDKYYSANLMTLAVIAPDNLDYLQTLVEDIFLNIPNKERERPFWPENPYGPNELQTSVEIVPISDLRSMSVTFPIPYTIEQYKTFVSCSYFIGDQVISMQRSNSSFISFTFFSAHVVFNLSHWARG